MNKENGDFLNKATPRKKTYTYTRTHTHTHTHTHPYFHT